MKGLVIPSKVRMNQEGWTMMNILRFFFSLWDKLRIKQELKKMNKEIKHVSHSCSATKSGFLSSVEASYWSLYETASQTNGPKAERILGNSRLRILPPIYHLITLFHPCKAGESTAGCGAVQVHNHIIFCHH